MPSSAEPVPAIDASRLERHPRGASLAPAEPQVLAAVEVRLAPGLGHGLFAGENLVAGQLVGIDGGIVLTSLAGLPPGPAYAALLGEGIYLAPQDYRRLDPLCYLNHSCESNLERVGGLVYLAKRDVARDEMLTIDYAPLVSGHEGWRMECQCGAASCRGEITAVDWRRPELARRLWREWLPFIQRRILAEGILSGA
jgi:hypothetical protein